MDLFEEWDNKNYFGHEKNKTPFDRKNKKRIFDIGTRFFPDYVRKHSDYAVA